MAHELNMHPMVKEAKKHMVAGRHDQALNCMEQALAHHRKIGDRFNEAGNLHNIGMLYTMKGDLHKALLHYQQALEIAEELQITELAQSIDHNLNTIMSSLQIEPKKKKKRGLGRIFGR